MLIEYLVAESGGVKCQESAVCISRLIIAGNSLASLAPIVTEPGPTLEDKKAVGFFIYSHFLIVIQSSVPATIWI